ncbi:P2 phage tail completion protein R (GpR) [compost metagenome]
MLEWLRRNQPELLTNLERGKDAIAFEADILDGGKVDMSLSLPLTERVIVKRQDDGTLDVTHPDEPDFEL